ncbi:MAG: radical SAM protein [Bdellovibrionaceae bacterium]|jgi:hypothetical protein|nr:radical SAM protein [Pseudobdellovibrionaceae bacterium]
MESISLSINPSYYCNFRCDFCYLSEAQLSSSQRITPDELYSRLLEISMHRKISHIDLYGGEIGILPSSYLDQIKKIMRYFYQGPISVITNLKVINPFFASADVDLSVSWDYLARESHAEVYENMKKLGRPFHVLMLASRKLIDIDDSSLNVLWEKLNGLPNLQSLEIKPYSKNPHHPQEVSFIQFENWVKKWVSQVNQFPFEFINLKKIEKSLSGNVSAWSDDHVYITPSGKLAVLEFDANHNEFFMPLNSMDEYFAWTDLEKRKINSNQYCSKCEYLGSCLSEHLQEVVTLSNSCNGFKNLLDWYKNERA